LYAVDVVKTTKNHQLYQI